MHNPKISLIAAIGQNRELGKDNKLLWHIPEDMKRFKTLTTGHVVIMGRKTYESIGKTLPDRINIVITHNISFATKDCIITRSLEEAIGIAKTKEREEIFIIGGGQIYAQSLSYADKLYLTIVHRTCQADTFFPDYSQFKKTIFQQKASYRNLSYTFQNLIK